MARETFGLEGRHAAPANEASMRPGRFGPGDFAELQIWYRQSPGFNEARALWPGRRGIRQREADQSILYASMRPGRFGPGDAEASL